MRAWWLEIALAIIAALGTILTAYVGTLAWQTKRAVNGKVDELAARVKLLESVVEWAAGDELRDCELAARSRPPT